MDMIKKDDIIIIRPDGRAIDENFEGEPETGKITSIDAGAFIRLEHPHCAFFKSTHSSGGSDLKRTTLYTPEGRLHRDQPTDDAQQPEFDKYVTKKENLDILLFYLRDVSVTPAPAIPEEKAVLVRARMPKTPLADFLSFVQEELFLTVMDEYEIMAKHILNQFRRIYNDKITILSEKIRGMVEHAVFDDVPDIGISEELLERWHLYYIRKARLLK